MASTTGHATARPVAVHDIHIEALTASPLIIAVPASLAPALLDEMDTHVHQLAAALADTQAARALLAEAEGRVEVGRARVRLTQAALAVALDGGLD